MNTFLKKSLFVLVATLAFTQMGCGVYYDPFYGDGWIVEEEIIVSQPVGYFASERLTFEIQWNGFSSDLESKLITPLNACIEDNGYEIDGCYFLGTYNESHGNKVSLIECIDPYHGMYDLKLRNFGFFTLEPYIKVIKEYRDGYGVTQQVSTQSPMINHGDTAVLHYNF